MPIEVYILPSEYGVNGEDDGSPPRFSSPLNRELALRQAAHDAVEITKLKRENVRLVENSKWKPKWQPTHAHKTGPDKILVLKADEHYHEFQYREEGKIHRMATRDFWKYFYPLPPGSK